MSLAMSSSITSFFARVAALALLLLPLSPRAADMSQTITLHPGWNAIYVSVQPNDNEIESVFANIPVRSVWRWIPGREQVQFIRDPSEGLENVEGWFAWFPEPRPDAMLTNLFTIDGNIITGEGPAATLPYSYEILRMFKGDDTVASLKEGMMYNHLMAEGK